MTARKEQTVSPEALEDTGAKNALLAARNSVEVLRQQRDKAKAVLAQKEREAHEITKEAKHVHERAKDACAAAESELRALQLEHPTVEVDGVEVRQNNVLDYDDSLALQFCVDRALYACLSLNRKPFEAIVSPLGLAVQGGIVRQSTKPAVRIARDLSKHIGDEKSD